MRPSSARSRNLLSTDGFLRHPGSCCDATRMAGDRHKGWNARTQRDGKPCLLIAYMSSLWLRGGADLGQRVPEEPSGGRVVDCEAVR